MNTNLLVSCIMPTHNRRAFVPRAIEYFLRQDYERKELLILDDGEDAVADLIPNDPCIRYIRLGKRLSVGAKRNMSCDLAKGDIIAHWDDDDWHAPHRLSYQVGELLRSGAEVCGINSLLFYSPEKQQAWKYTYPANGRFWLSGSTLCYHKHFWQTHPFPDLNVGEDTRFVWSGEPQQMLVLSDYTFHIGMIHGSNVSPKRTTGAWWQPYPPQHLQQLMGNSESPPTQVDVPSERSLTMMTMAHESDLTLPEFRAFNHGLSLPRMRRWELPFALFQSRLENTSSVLDCTINAAGFQEQLHRLYPHVLYRHHNPLQNGSLVLPTVPDEAFDRVICVNTLEHLVSSQRELLIAALARKLKPGGRLLLTSDYYFDSLWQRPEVLNMGVMRADRSEVPGGWNKVGFADWLELTKRNGLKPLGKLPSDPSEHDPGLYRNQEPFPHACIGGVFVKGRNRPPKSKRVVLALLTWNTCQISLESIWAYQREAQMLQRLGHEALICVCDNGSTDGTVQALRGLEGVLEVPYKLILNTENRGNSIARNQLIQAMLEWEGDYLLLMDGDIEIVPFSSFAMLRHLENNGHRLGCIGADSIGQSLERSKVSSCYYAVENNHIEQANLVAWTQYGMFRRAVFEDNIRFDEAHPFDGAGWGFEDNDLAFQMDQKGYLNQRFSGMVYLHRAAQSSVRILRSQGFDPQELFNRRRQYVLDKWASVPSIHNGPLEIIRRYRTLGA